MIVVLGLPLNVDAIILGCIFSVLFSDRDNVRPLPVSYYFISPFWMYLFSCMHIVSMLWSIAEAVSSGRSSMSLFILFFCIWVIFVLVWGSQLIFGSLGPGLQTQREVLFFTSVKNDAVLTCGLSMIHGNLSMAMFYSHLQRPTE